MAHFVQAWASTLPKWSDSIRTTNVALNEATKQFAQWEHFWTKDFWPSRTRVLTSDPSAAQATRRRPEPKAVNAVTARGRLHREARVVAEAAGLRYSSDADKQIQTGMSTSQ